MSSSISVLVINGPNLNLLGKRQPEVYGFETLEDLDTFIEEGITELAEEYDFEEVSIGFFQSNHEGEIIDVIHEAGAEVDCIIINPGAYSHYSYAIYDALLAVDIPTFEVHISDINSREEFRKTSVVSAACAGVISGEGFQSYLSAAERLMKIIKNSSR
jgi:3-dehydroquinate dehydratase-2